MTNRNSSLNGLQKIAPTGMNARNPYLALRYGLDRLFAGLILLTVLPLMAIVALFIARDGGPVFYRQARLGEDGEEFSIYKFRSMIVNADDYLDAQDMPTRSRVTKVGRVIRKTSIDELPQLINILRGEMALIGPRPILPRMLPYMTAAEKQRFNSRPGMTGLAQVNGRNNLRWSKRFEMDVDYVQRASLWLDIKILWATVCAVCKSTDIATDRNTAQVDDVTNRELPQKDAQA